MRRSKRSATSLTGFAEDELLSRARRLDAYALGELHERYFSEVYRYIYYRLGDEGIVQDIAADVFLRFLEAVQRRRGPKRNLSGWLLKTAASLVDERLRQVAKARPPRVEGDPLLDRLPTTGDDEAQRQTLQVRQALQSLPAEQQHFLALRFAQERSLDQVAGLLNKPGHEVRSLQFRVLGALQRSLERDA